MCVSAMATVAAYIVLIPDLPFENRSSGPVGVWESDGRTVVIYRTGTLHDLVYGIRHTERHLKVRYGMSAYSFRMSLVDLADRLETTYHGDLYEPYSNLTSEQQAMYDDLALLLSDVHTMLRKSVSPRFEFDSNTTCSGRCVAFDRIKLPL